MPRSIAILGPESTGKSQLAFELAANYQANWVPEYARKYLTENPQPYTIADVEIIAEKQFELNQFEKAKNSTIWFADTEMLVCSIWTKIVFGSVPEKIQQLVNLQQFDFYLLCNIDLPWQSDPLREHPHRREEIFELYKMHLSANQWPFAVISGFGKQRIQHAIAGIEHHFNQTQ